MSIFSTYSTGENRVTASILAVLRSLSLDRIQRLLGALLEQAEFELIRFENQPSKGGTSVPDGMIHSSIRLLIETKTARNAVNLNQLRQHSKQLDGAKEAIALLLVLTPDDVRPSALDTLNNPQIVWASFTVLEQAIDEILNDKREVVSEREAFLLRELQGMMAEEGLTANVNDIAIVAAREAWPEYNDFHAYVCQPKRSFQQIGRLGFYSKGVIYPLVPKILASYDEVEMVRNAHSGELMRLVNLLLDKNLRIEGQKYKVLFLSAPDSPDTLVLPEPIRNDKLSKSGKPTAFTMGQRYVSTTALLAARTTSDLD